MCPHGPFSSACLVRARAEAVNSHHTPTSWHYCGETKLGIDKNILPVDALDLYIDDKSVYILFCKTSYFCDLAGLKGGETYTLGWIPQIK